MSQSITILIVDDEVDLLDNISLALEMEDYQVLTANNGIEALQQLATQPVHLILADIAMPDMNGYQLFERVRENPEWTPIPFLFLSARSLDSDIRYGKELGVDDYLTKPIRVADLLAAIRGKLRRAQQLNQAIQQLKPAVETGNTLLKIGRLKIDPQQYQVWYNNEDIKLSAREFVLLKYFAQHPGNVINLVELVKVTHDLNTDAIEAGTLLRPMILSVRRKFEASTGGLGLIENVRGVGYRLVVPD